jgi:hypothetical protein
VVNPDTFIDPTILEVTWGMKSVPDGRGGLHLVEGGTIMRQGQQPFVLLRKGISLPMSPQKTLEISPLFKVNPNVVLNVGWVRDGKLNVGFSGWDPTILEVTWGMKSVPDGKGGLRLAEGGTIMRQGQQPSSFFEIELLKPYLAAYEARRLEIARDQAEYDLAHWVRNGT